MQVSVDEQHKVKEVDWVRYLNRANDLGIYSPHCWLTNLKYPKKEVIDILNAFCPHFRQETRFRRVNRRMWRHQMTRWHFRLSLFTFWWHVHLRIHDLEPFLLVDLLGLGQSIGHVWSLGLSVIMSPLKCVADCKEFSYRLKIASPSFISEQSIQTWRKKFGRAWNNCKYCPLRLISYTLH